jgi:hypothetical protein
MRPPTWWSSKAVRGSAQRLESSGYRRETAFRGERAKIPAQMFHAKSLRITED